MLQAEPWSERRHKLNDYYLCLRNMALFELKPSALDQSKQWSWEGLEQEKWYWESELTKEEQAKVHAAYHKWWQQFMAQDTPQK